MDRSPEAPRDRSDDRSPEVWDERWDAAGVRRLRARLGLTQHELAERLGTRQQTVSERETGARAPRRMSRRLLRLVAEEAGVYDPAPLPAPPSGPPSGPREDAR